MYKIIQLFKLNDDFSNRIFGLDLLRFFAIVFVLHTHAGRFVPKILFDYYQLLYFDGVGMFFVLSGFLIGGILFKQLEKYKLNINFLFDFWIRRWFRTLPNYYLFLILGLVINGLNFLDYSNYFIFLQNLYYPIGSFFGESWSLAIEEWFYILLPLSLFVLSFIFKSFKLNFFLFFIIIIGICNYFRINNYLNHVDYSNVRYMVFCRLDGILYGVLGAYIANYYNDFWLKYKNHFLILGLSLLVIGKILSLRDIIIYDYLVESTLISIGIIFLIPYLSQVKQVKQTKLTYFITYISLISYSIYLVNMKVSDFLVNAMDWNAVLLLIQSNFRIKAGIWSMLLSFNFILFFLISILISALIYKYFEMPVTKLRDLDCIRNRFKKTKLVDKL